MTEMLTTRLGTQRGTTRLGWLDSRHTFSFGDYYDPKHHHYRTLRVINDDRIAPGGGFGTHPHRDMEIVTYVLEGALRHEDSLGTGSVIRPGDVQRMSAGSGIRHSEYNGSTEEPVHFLQIWLLPDEEGLTPSYEQKTFADDEKRGRLRLVASRDGRDGSVRIHQDADLYASLLDKDETATHALAAGRRGWIQVVRGGVEVNGQSLRAGDGAAASDLPTLEVKATADSSEFLLFDLP
jgi:hypothetical protein